MPSRPTMATAPPPVTTRRTGTHLSWVLAVGTLLTGVGCHVFVGWGGGHPLGHTDTSALLWIPVLALAPFAAVIAMMLACVAITAVLVCLWMRNWIGAVVSVFGGMLMWNAALSVGHQL